MKAKSARRMSDHFTKVTLLSKTIAFILFITLPFLGFFLGVKYGEMRAVAEQQEQQINTYLQQAVLTPSVTPQRQF